MMCVDCKAVVLVGQKCPQCGKQLALFQPPPGEFDKKGELYERTLQLRAAQISKQDMGRYIADQRAKLSRARAPLREGEEPLLEEAFQCWETALAQAEEWLQSDSDFHLQSALNWATQADLKINQSIAEEFERNCQALQEMQADLRLQGYQPP